MTDLTEEEEEGEEKETDTNETEYAVNEMHLQPRMNPNCPEGSANLLPPVSNIIGKALSIVHHESTLQTLQDVSSSTH